MAAINFSGIASGIDSSALIEALLTRERAVRIKPLEDRSTEYEETNSTLSQLKTLLNTLKDKASAFRTLNGGALSKQALSDDETVITAAASNGATNGSYDISIAARAKNATFSFNDRFASTSTTVNSSINDGDSAINRTVTFSVGSGDSEEIVSLELTSTTTASEFIELFNSSSEKATASLVNVGTTSAPSYAVVINSKQEGLTDGSITLTSVGSALAAGAGAFQTNSLSQATDASFTVSGVSGSISRSSNTVSDVISGVTLNLNSIGSAKISVSDDTAQTTSTMQDFVDAYNAVVEYIAENDRISQEQEGEETTNIFGALAKTSLDENVLSTLRQALSDAGISGGSINTLADLGITTKRDGTLAFDTDIFEEAMANDPESIRDIAANLGESLSAVDGKIAQFTRFNGIFDVAAQSNQEQITSLQNRIAELEKSLSSREQALIAQFSRLEATIGRLQNQQSALTAALPG